LLQFCIGTHYLPFTTDIIVAEGNKTYKSYDGCLYDASGSELIYSPAGKKEITLLESISSIGGYAIGGDLTSIELPSGLTHIGGVSI
jgi:hypothetical protein